MSSAKDCGSARQYLTLAACIALCVPAPLSGLAQSGLAPIMPQITAHFAGDPNAGLLVRAMVSGLSAAMIIGAVSSGYLAERFGQMRLMVASLGIFALAGTAGCILNDLYLMVASRLVLGVANAIAGVMAMAILTTRVPPEGRERWMGFYIVGSTGGSVVAVVLIGWIAAWGWRYGFLPYLAAFPAALWIAFSFPRAEEKQAAAPDAAQPRGRVSWSNIGFGVWFGAVGSAPGMYVPFHLAAIGFGDPGTLAAIMVASAGVGALASFTFGWVRLRLSVIQVFVLSLLLSAAAMLVVAAAQTTLEAQIGMALSGAGVGLLAPNFFAAAAATAPPEARTRLLGQCRGAFYAGPLAAQPVLELVMHGGGAAVALAGIAAVALAGILLTLVFRSVFRPFAGEA